MNDLFMGLLLTLQTNGNLTEANLYSGGTFATMKIENANGTYEISISKKGEEEIYANKTI